MNTPTAIIEEKYMQEDLLSRRRRAMGPAYRLFYSKPVHLVLTRLGPNPGTIATAA